ncbi:MAG: type III secretion system stator protein SctL [Deltaproteobacteria bacterium]|nr:type III secretion system stator protein SctL [Deltaproteobacteria bacterium]
MGRIIRADQNGPKRLSPERLEAQNNAREILEQARSRAERLYQDAERDIRELKERAYDEGRQEGLARAAELVIRAETERKQMLAAAEKEIVELALIAAQRIVQQKLCASPETIAALVRPLIERAQRARAVTIRLSPHDLQALETALPKLLSDTRLDCAVQLEPDESITRGGCVLVSDAGTFDARIEVQLEALARLLQKEGTGRHD